MTKKELIKQINESLDLMPNEGGAVILIVEQKNERHGVLVYGFGKRLLTIIASVFDGNPRIRELFNTANFAISVKKTMKRGA